MKLTKLTLVLFLLILTAGVLQSQNMTVTLGTGGLFTIKDTSNNYLTLSQSTGQVNLLRNLRLELTDNDSSSGVIYKGANRFLHDYSPIGIQGRNTFLGINSGNFTMYIINPEESTCNTGIGYSSLRSLTRGYNNTAVGHYSLRDNTTGNENTAVGNWSLTSLTTGIKNTAIGSASLASNTSGHNNTAVGYISLNHNSTGYSNTGLGSYSLYLNTTGYENTTVGLYSLGSNTTGNFNTGLGYHAGYNISTGNNLTCLGYDAQPTSGTATNQITLGNNQVTSLRCNVTTITSLSDARDKKNIKDLNIGLDFLMNVKPRLFNWDKREWYDYNVSDGSKIQETPTAGFIAQEFDEVQITQNAEWLNLVLKDNPEKLEATPGNLLPIMVKAIQELKIENDELRNKNDNLEEKLAKFEQMQSYLVDEIEKLKSNEGEVLKTSSK